MSLNMCKALYRKQFLDLKSYSFMYGLNQKLLSTVKIIHLFTNEPTRMYKYGQLSPTLLICFNDAYVYY